MSDLIPLTFQRHAAFGWSPRVTPAAEVRRDPALTLDEVPPLALGLPVVLRASAGRIEPVVPLRVLADGALSPFHRSGAWRQRVVPGALFDTPFRIVSSEKGQVVMADVSRLGPRDDAAFPLFDAGGDLSADTARELRRLRAWRDGLAAARSAGAALREAGLLTRWRDQMALYCVDEARLAALAPEIAGQLHGLGALKLAHLSLASLHTLALGRAAPTRAPEPAAPAADTDTGRNAFLDAFRADSA